MGSTLLPSQDHPFTGESPGFEYAEAQQWNLTDGQYGVIYHVCSMPGDLKLWHNVFAVTRPDGALLVAKIIGRGERHMFGTHPVHAVTLEPYKSFLIHFDGAARRYDSQVLWADTAKDGEHIPLQVALEVSAAHPVWEPGARREDHEHGLFRTTWRMHHEQALRAKGRIVIDGRVIEFSGVGHRDHSFGPRDSRSTVRHFWVNALFESGWAFATVVGSLDPGGEFERGAVFEGGGKISDASVEEWSKLTAAGPQPRAFPMALRRADGRLYRINVTCDNGINWTGVGRTEWCIGTDRSDPANYLFNQHFAVFECEGERGLGFVDRGARLSMLKTP